MIGSALLTASAAIAVLAQSSPLPAQQGAKPSATAALEEVREERALERTKQRRLDRYENRGRTHHKVTRNGQGRLRQ